MPEKILVLDDEPLVLSTIEKALSKVGYEVRGTCTAEDFLEALKAERAPLLIMDIHLEDGAESTGLMAKAREVSPHSRILVISGSDAAYQGKHFLEKPFRIDELRQKVREILDEPA